MHVDDILKIKGEGLYTVSPEEALATAVETMAKKDLGSLVVMSGTHLEGILTFREVITALVKAGGALTGLKVASAMEKTPLTCTPHTDVAEVRRMMLDHHARYMPVMEAGRLHGVISFYDVAKAVVESQAFENKMLKAYIRDWPVDSEDSA